LDPALARESGAGGIGQDIQVRNVEREAFGDYLDAYDEELVPDDEDYGDRESDIVDYGSQDDENEENEDVAD
jgi:hypothetical protein